MPTHWNFQNSYLQLPDAFYAKCQPEAKSSPKIVLWNERLAKSLGVSPNDPQIGIEPIAQAYAGHQFGHFNMLGDGRCILLGEHIVGQNRFDIQLKGAGVTPYSRRGDGKATLPAMVREYIISEAMVGLGIPSTQSLAVTLTGESVMRETDFAGAVLTRVASSHLRVGTFQYAANLQDFDKLKALCNYAMKRHYPDCATPLEFLEAMIARQAKLIAQWVAVGFIHGVMNTDNMTISGDTIDYGPCAFMDIYDPNTVFSSIDTTGRYAYGNQGKIGLWNLTRFAESLLVLFDTDINKAITIAENALDSYQSQFQNHWLALMRLKLGLLNEEPQDLALIQGFLDILEKQKLDYTESFTALTRDEQMGKAFDEWNTLYQQRLMRNQASFKARKKAMSANNPVVIARNYHVEAALAAANDGDFSKTLRLVQALQKPFEQSKEFADLQTTPQMQNGYKTFCGT